MNNTSMQYISGRSHIAHLGPSGKSDGKLASLQLHYIPYLHALLSSRASISDLFPFPSLPYILSSLYQQEKMNAINNQALFFTLCYALRLNENTLSWEYDVACSNAARRRKRKRRGGHFIRYSGSAFFNFL